MTYHHRSQGPGRNANPSVGSSRMLGLTLPELVIALAVSAILLSVGAPAMSNIVKNNRLVATSFDLLETINLARSEAVKRRVRVILCRSADPLAGNPTCGGTTQTWTTGWIVFASGDSNNTYQPGVDVLLGRGPAATADLTVMTNGTSNNNLEYNSDGTTNENGFPAYFSICDGRGGPHGRQIHVPPHGRPRIIQGTIGAPIDCTP